MAASAVRAVARRTAELPHIRVEQRELPCGWPAGRFDLIVFSEFLYYFGDHDLERVLKKVVAALEPEGTLLAVHWSHPVADYPRSGALRVPTHLLVVADRCGDRTAAVAPGRGSAGDQHRGPQSGRRGRPG